MKATVEFEVNGCHDCVLCFTDTYEPIMYCTHPQKADNMPDTGKYVYKRTFPKWCPLIKSEEKQKMTFEKVLQAMKEGKKVKRKAWDFNYEGYCTNQDLLADDWEIVGEEQPKPKNYLSEAMSQSADKITECVQKQMTQALEEVSERQDEEIAQKAIEEMKKRAKLRDFIESIGITDEKIEKIFKAIHLETLFDVIDGEYEKIKVRGIRELAESRGFYGDYNLSSETAAKALTILIADICDNQQQQINDLQTQIKNLNKRMNHCNID